MQFILLVYTFRSVSQHFGLSFLLVSANESELYSVLAVVGTTSAVVVVKVPDAGSGSDGWEATCFRWSLWSLTAKVRLGFGSFFGGVFWVL